MAKFEGRIREDSRGGWIARAKVIKEDGGQLREQVLAGPYVFRNAALCRRWLKKAAAELLIEDVTIQFEPSAQSEPVLGTRTVPLPRQRLRPIE